MHTPMIQNFPTQEEIKPLDDLHGLGLGDDRDIQQTVVRYGVGGLSVARGIAYADRHKAFVYRLRIDMEVHEEVGTLEEKQETG